MFKLSILLFAFVSVIQAQTTTTMAPNATPKPEDCANKIYTTIKGFKGSKEDLLARLEAQFNEDTKAMRATPANVDAFKNVVELVAKRIQKDDPITVDEFRKFMENAIMKRRATEKN